MSGFIRWVVAWVLFIVLIIGASRLQPGEKLLTYTLWLMIVLIVVTHYKEIADVLGTNILTQGQA